jgi:hypothetical protein
MNELTDTLITVHDGFWGNWEAPVIIPEGFYVYGMQVRFEPGSSNNDDTALNGIRILCSTYDGKSQRTITVHEGFWGDWRKVVAVPNRCYVIGVATRIEYPQPNGGDDTALNGIKMIYRNLDNSTTGAITVEDGLWGSWAGEASVPEGSLLAGLQVRIEAPQGKGDDTAMNGVKVVSRPFNLTLITEAGFIHESKIKSNSIEKYPD